MPEVEILAKESDEKVNNIVHFIYHSKRYEGASKITSFRVEPWKSTGRPVMMTLCGASNYRRCGSDRQSGRRSNVQLLQEEAD